MDTQNAFSLLSPEIRAKLQALSITQPTPVQQKTIPLIIEGKNLLFQSETGTGKTFAYLLPLADNIEVFCRTASLASLFPDTYSAIVVDGKQVSDFFADLTPVLSEFEEALKANDTVLVGDLAEYEICPRLKLASKALEVFHAL